MAISIPIRDVSSSPEWMVSHSIIAVQPLGSYILSQLVLTSTTW